MTESECEAILAKLFAAYSRPPVEPLTVEVYREQIEPLGYEQSLEAINLLIRGPNPFRPTVGEILEVYRSLRDKYAQPALKEPPMSEEQRQENLRQAKLMVARLAKSNEMQEGTG